MPHPAHADSAILAHCLCVHVYQFCQQKDILPNPTLYKYTSTLYMKLAPKYWCSIYLAVSVMQWILLYRVSFKRSNIVLCERAEKLYYCMHPQRFASLPQCCDRYPWHSLVSRYQSIVQLCKSEASPAVVKATTTRKWAITRAFR